MTKEYEKVLEEQKDPLCTCGDLESQHYENEKTCVIADCGCKEFEPAGVLGEEG